MKKRFLIFWVTAILVKSTSISNAQGDIKKWDYYFDAGFGSIPKENGFYGTSGVSTGVQYKSIVGLGAILISTSDDWASASGYGLDLRITPAPWFLMKMQLGNINSARGIDDSGPGIYRYSKKESKNFFWRTTVALKITQVLFIGVSTINTGEIVYNVEYPTLKEVSTKKFNIITYQIGISLPAKPKKKKIIKS